MTKLNFARLTLGVRRKPIVIFDSPLAGAISELFMTKFSESQIGFFDPRFRTIALVPFVLALASGLRSQTKSFTVRYLVWFLRISRPDVLVSGAHNNAFLYEGKLLSRLPRLRLVVFQNGHSHADQLPRGDGMASRDVIFCLSESYVQVWKGCLPGVRVIPSGSLQSLKFRQSHSLNSVQRPNVGFISPRSAAPSISERGLPLVSGISGRLVRETEFYGPELVSLKRIIVLMRALGVTFNIFGSSITAPDEERDFYERNLGKQGFGFLERKSVLSSYDLVAKSDLVICTDSTLGFEALSMGKSVAFVEMPQRLAGKHRIPTLYPSDCDSEELGPLILGTNESNEIWLSKIRFLMSMPQGFRTNLAQSVLGEKVLRYSMEDLRKELELDSGV